MTPPTEPRDALVEMLHWMFPGRVEDVDTLVDRFDAAIRAEVERAVAAAAKLDRLVLRDLQERLERLEHEMHELWRPDVAGAHGEDRPAGEVRACRHEIPESVGGETVQCGLQEGHAGDHQYPWDLRDAEPTPVASPAVPRTRCGEGDLMSKFIPELLRRAADRLEKGVGG